MVEVISSSRNHNIGKMTLQFNYTNENDHRIIDKIHHLLFDEQPHCENCVNYYREGYFCGYRAMMCKVHGGLDAWDHPHHDLDGSKCDDYERK
jgi:hypothetical protein